ncbi:MAG: hypothetical protein JW864_06315 [Spirochaetes bacterium]|nr:hypothetical protein [Spirochaetota bacterium]
MAKPLLGEMLVDGGEITQEQLDKALEIQKEEGGLIGIILVNLNFINEQTLVKYLASQAERVVKS